MKRIIVAIDGPASSGKSTTARKLAERLGYVYLDTGAMYRACALYAEQNNVSVSNETGINELMSQIDIKITFALEGNQVLLNGIDVSNEIRREKISRLASDISALKNVRIRMVDLQREMGKAGGVVLDGRDIGTVVFPQAEIKFFMTADAETRARRRWLELRAKGLDPSFDNVLSELVERDKNDSSRELAPLKAASDAILVDTTDLSVDQQVDLLYGYIEQYLEQK